MGRIPVIVSLNERATVTAGFANEVEDVSHDAARIYAATANGTTVDLWSREQPQITAIKPKVAINSPSHCEAPVRVFVDAKKTGRSNIVFAAATPNSAPANCDAA